MSDTETSLHYNHASIDLETLGTGPRSCVLTVGITLFSVEHEAVRSLQVPLVLQAQLELGRTVDAGTIGWWFTQSEEARLSCGGAFTQFVTSDAARSNLDAQLDLIEYNIRDCDHVWGFGADFDLAMLADVYRSAGRPVPWAHWKSRCLRTLAMTRPEVNRIRSQVPHNAEEDSRAQALWIRNLLTTE